MSADESITELAAAVAELGALPMPVPVGPEPQEADADVVAARAAQVISAMGAELRGLKKESDRLFLAWGSARMRSRRKNEALKKLKARVAELEAERHSTNEAKADAVQALRVNAAPSPSFAERAAAESDPGRRAAYRMLAESEGEFDSFLRHPYRVGHDLPETGGQR